MKSALVLITAIFRNRRDAADIAGVKVPPPFAVGTTTDIYWNVKVPDPYRALENVADPQVQQWMRSHAITTRLNYGLGHGGGGTRTQQQAQTADIWSFFLWQFGVPEFQPK